MERSIPSDILLRTLEAYMAVRNEELFTGKAGIYGKFRPIYPKEFIDYLFTEVGFNTNSVIADIGSGTGIFSRLLIERGSKVYSIEPNDDMRLNAENDLNNFAERNNFISVNAHAENTGLHEKSVDFVVAAQAFHWFDKTKFKTECRRILRPGGKVILAWNLREYHSEFMKKDYSVREKYCIENKSFGLIEQQKSNLCEFFSDEICDVKTFRNDMVLDKDSYIGMTLTRSYIPDVIKNPKEYNGLVKELNTVFDNYNVNGVINILQVTKSYFGYV